MTDYTFQRGSEWRQWDLHIHSPASFHWDGPKFVGDPSDSANIPLIDTMIKALNDAEPAVFALMDYWTFDGWFALKKRLAQPDAPELKKVVFPGIELRLISPTTYRLNAHVIFSDKISDQILRDFKSDLKVQMISKTRPLSDDALIELARTIGTDKLNHIQANISDVLEKDEAALNAGSKLAEIVCDSYKEAIQKVPEAMAVGMMPWDTSDGLEGVQWKEHYSYFIGLFRSSPIFESRKHDKRCAFINEETEGNTKWLKSFQEALGNVPRLVVSGSDAHRFKGTAGNNDKRGYGDYPSGKITWIKADPSFRGLLQAIMEPAKRSHIGERPQKLTEIEHNKTFFLDRVEVFKNSEPAVPGKWLEGCNVLLNHDLVAIIGSKGSGKSALADIIALLGNSRQKVHFSFLKKDRFRGKTGEPAKHFTGRLTWVSGALEERSLEKDAEEKSPEMVRYIPQGHFEALCNDHVSGKSNAFEKELRSVIFSHMDDEVRLGALDFDQLIEKQESGWRDKLQDYRNELERLNAKIESLEAQLQPDVLAGLEELLNLKRKQLAEHEKIEPAVPVKPSEELTEAQTEAAKTLESLSRKEAEIDLSLKLNRQNVTALVGKLRSLQSLKERMRSLDRTFSKFVEESTEDLGVLNLKVEELLRLETDYAPLDKIESEIGEQKRVVEETSSVSSKEKVEIEKQRKDLNEKLNADQVRYQQELQKYQEWSIMKKDLEGAPDVVDSLSGLNARINQIQKLPEILNEKENERIALAKQIFATLDGQRQEREKLFRPVHQLIAGNKLIRDEYRLQFKASLYCSHELLSDNLFSVLKQNSGEFRGDEESRATVQNILDSKDLNTESGAMEFVLELLSKLRTAAHGGKSGVGIVSLLRKERVPSQVYNKLFGFEFLEPRYSLLFQDTGIEQLSPGQRGALLLIFYLLVDKGRMPIILDQPEENLDNETVVSLLVPVLAEAKKKRQIIMVTHNPNLAVVCDAEQVIHSSFDRKNGSKITYVSGSIEHSLVNEHVVTVLEGTKPAFDNRRIKYH